MPIVTTRGFYALAAMTELLNYPVKKAVKIKEIAKNADVPQKYLEQILLDLKKNNLLKSIKGAHGGYLLAKSAQKILIWEILDAVENDFLKEDFSSQNPVMKLYWKESFSSLKEVFNHPLSDLIQFQQRADSNFMFHI
jgi:Rrf2 family transcriptional regulator, cysteine metabolism repressor